MQLGSKQRTDRNPTNTTSTAETHRSVCANPTHKGDCNLNATPSQTSVIYNLIHPNDALNWLPAHGAGSIRLHQRSTLPAHTLVHRRTMQEPYLTRL
jgi:hypothetical protein